MYLLMVKEVMSAGDLDGQVLVAMLLSMRLWWRRRLHMRTLWRTP
jgi:hypothetical protein